MRWMLIAGLVGLTAANVFGDTTIGSLAANTNPSGGHALLGQSFVMPSGEQGLTTAKFQLRNVAGVDVNAVWKLYAFSFDADTNAGTFGAELASAPFVLPAAQSATIYTHTFNTPLTAGNTYAVAIDLGAAANQAGGFFSSSSYYADGRAIFQSPGQPSPQTFPDYDMAFEATFGSVPEPVLLAAVAPGLLMVRRHRQRV